jgi:tRNA-dihydrouridine synthase B
MTSTASKHSLTDPFRIGDVWIPNRVLLAPLAGIGNWFVRLQARRHGAGLAVSEMVSSFALHHGNRRTMVEMLRIHPDEHPVSLQLFGQDPEVMRSAAAIAADAGADLIDLNMGCPVRKVCKTGAGAALLRDPDRALTLVLAARAGSGLPVTVKLRSGVDAGDRSGFDLALRLAEEGGAAAIGFHPRPAASHHGGAPDYELAAELAARLEAGPGVPLIISGGLRSATRARAAFERSRADAVMIARGALGYPWIFEELTGRRTQPPAEDEVVRELHWLLDRGAEHFGPERAARNLRKLYPWYLERLGITGERAGVYQRTKSLDEVRELLATRRPTAPDAAQFPLGAAL